MSKVLYLYYSKKKLFLLLILSIVLLYIFFWSITNADALANTKPKNYVRHEWVGHLTYENPLLIKVTNSLFFILFLYGFFISIKMLLKSKVEFKNLDNNLYIDKKFITSFKDIKSFENLKYNKNEEYFRIYLNDPEKYISSKKNKFTKYILKSNYKRYGTPLIINIRLYKDSPEIIKDNILELKRGR